MIDNKTVLNTSLFTPLSSGAIDNHMSKEASINTTSLPIDLEKEEKIPIGDRQTISIFNEEYEWNDIKLWTNFFLLNLHQLDIGKTVFINFKTTKDWSFNIHFDGSKAFEYDVHKLDTADLWEMRGMVQNLEKYFDGDEELEFNFTVHKSHSNAHWVGVNIGPREDLATITYDANGTRGSLVEQWKLGEDHTVRDILSEDDTRPIRRMWWKDFGGWNTEPDGSGTHYNQGDVINIISDITLYAIWKERFK